MAGKLDLVGALCDVKMTVPDMSVTESIRRLLRPLLTPGLRRRLRTLHPGRRPIRWGNLRRLTPVSRVFGLDRGQAIDRYYIERFLERHHVDIAGRVLEIGDATYTRRFGGARVSRSDVLHAVPGNPDATLVGDLATGEGIPTAAFDCLILTQTLSHIYEVSAAIAHAHAALTPGGVLLATVPGISQISRYDADRWGDFWRFTPAAVTRIFAEVYGAGQVEVVAQGNVLVACAFLQGLSAEELTTEELVKQDRDYPVLITVRAVKRGND